MYENIFRRYNLKVNVRIFVSFKIEFLIVNSRAGLKVSVRVKVAKKGINDFDRIIT